MNNKNILTCSIFFLILFFSSCNNDEDNNESYLDLNNNQYSDINNNIIIREAKDRLTPYLNIKNNKYTLSITSGKKINVSDDLFENLVKDIDYINDQISKDSLLLMNGIPVPSNQSIENSSPRLKSGSEGGGDGGSTEYFWWGYVTTVKYTKQAAYDAYHSFNGSATAGSIVLGLIGLTVNPYYSAFTTTYASLMAAADAQKIYDAAKSGSMTITTIHYWGSYNDITEITDAKGNRVYSGTL